MGNISKYFNFSEFVRKEDWDSVFLFIPDIAERVTKKLVKPVLEPLRIFLDIKIRITSGYRSDAYNAAIGGKPHSHHLFQADRSACDFTCPDMPAAWKWLAEHNDRFCYAYWDKERNFIHLSGSTKTDHRIGQTWIIGKKEKKI